MARTVLFSETFNGADQNPLSDAGAWTSNPSSWAGGVKRASSVARAINGATHSSARCETTVPTTQFAKVTGLNVDATVVALGGVCTRMQADGSCYVLYYFPNGNVVNFYRFDSGSFGGVLMAMTVVPASNVTLELRSRGGFHGCYFNGTLLGTWYDATYASGKTGFACYDAGTGSTIAYFESGSLATPQAELTLGATNQDTFQITQNPLSESGKWLKPTINAGTNAARHWFDGLQAANLAWPATDNQHGMMYLSGSFKSNQFAAGVCQLGSNNPNGSFAAVLTRAKSNGDSYLAILDYDLANGFTVRLLYYTDAGDPGANQAEAFTLLQQQVIVPTDNIALIELYSSGNTHKVYCTFPQGVRTLVISVTDTTYPTGGAPAIAGFNRTPPTINSPLHAFYGGSIITPSGGGSDAGAGLAGGIGFRGVSRYLLRP